MPARNNHPENHPSLKPQANGKNNDDQQFSLKRKKSIQADFSSSSKENESVKDYAVLKRNSQTPSKQNQAEESSAANTKPLTETKKSLQFVEPETVSQNVRKSKYSETWLSRRGHTITYALLFFFTFVLYFRPYELIPGLESFSSIALFSALATLIAFVPSQLATEGSLTARPAEVNWILILTLFGIMSIPIARNPIEAWAAFNDPFIKVVLMFIVMINVVRTETRLKGLIWLGLAVGVMLSIEVIKNYLNGNFSVEGYRAMADIKGMFGNPNAQAMHFVSITPIAVALAFATRNFLAKLIYIALTILFIAGNVLTFSRGGFLGLIITGLVLAWKIGRASRFKVMLASAVIGLIFTAAAPGNYGLRILSIFFPGLDPVGSSAQRSDLLKTSIIVTLRNPWGIGMMNFPLVNPHGLVTHNSYTQVSSEMGVLALFVYLMLIITPFKRLAWIEREHYEAGNISWIYYLSIGLQASLAGYAVSSFFDSAAYQWFLYYLVAYAVCLRRVLQVNKESYSVNAHLISANRIQTLEPKFQT